MKYFFKKIHKGFPRTFSKKGMSGFTIVETLVALSIFSLSVTALIVVAGQGISNTGSAGSKITADYLAQEGVEIIRNMRDTALISIINKKQQNAWSGFIGNVQPYTNTKPSYSVPIDGISDCISFSGINKFCTVSFIGGPNISPCPGLLCPNLTYDKSSGSYGYIYATQTPFQRVISVTYPSWPNTDEIKVDSTVYFGTNLQQSVTYSENMFNWPIP